MPRIKRSGRFSDWSFDVNRNAETVSQGHARIAGTYHRGRVDLEEVNIQWLDGFRGFLPESGRVADLGCGSGVPITRYFASRGYEVTGYDLSKEMLEIAIREVPGAEFYQSAIEELVARGKLNVERLG